MQKYSKVLFSSLVFTQEDFEEPLTSSFIIFFPKSIIT